MVVSFGKSPFVDAMDLSKFMYVTPSHYEWVKKQKRKQDELNKIMNLNKGKLKIDWSKIDLKSPFDRIRFTTDV